MSISGISSYQANAKSRRSSGASSSNQLAALLKRSSVNSKMLTKAYTRLNKTTGKNYLNRTDISAEDVSEKYLGISGSSVLNGEALKENTAKLRNSSMALLGADKMSGSDFVKSVKSFADDYNSTVNALKKSDNYVAVANGASMTNTTKSYASSLEKAGITINEDNTLSVDEKTLGDNADYAKLLFKGNYSFGGKTAKKASELYDLSKLGSGSLAGIYNRFGSFLTSGGGLF